MLPPRRLMLALCWATAALSAPMAQAAKHSFPNMPIRMIVPFPPGGGADAVARLLAQNLSTRLGQPVVVDNRAGANGSIGTAAVAKAAPDGYTLLFTDRGALGINPGLYKNLPYDPLKDFAYVGIAARSPYLLVQKTALASRSVDSLVSLAKASTCKLNYASFGMGSVPQLAMESFNAHFSTCITHVPYKGGGPALAAIMAGEVDVALVALGPALPLIKDRRITPLAIGAARRSDLLPHVPTLGESGAPPDLLPDTWFGLAYPRQTPKPVIDRIVSEVRSVLLLPEVRNRLKKSGFHSEFEGSSQMTREVTTDVEHFARELQRHGIQPE